MGVAGHVGVDTRLLLARVAHNGREWIVLTYAKAVRGGWRALVRAPDYYWFLLAIYGGWVLAYFFKAPVIMVPFYVSYLIPLTFLSLGLLIAPIVDRLSTRSYASLLVSVVRHGWGSLPVQQPELRWRRRPGRDRLSRGSDVAVVAIPVPEQWRPTAFVALLIAALGGFISQPPTTALRFGTATSTRRWRRTIPSPARGSDGRQAGPRPSRERSTSQKGSGRACQASPITLVRRRRSDGDVLSQRGVTRLCVAD